MAGQPRTAAGAGGGRLSRAHRSGRGLLQALGLAVALATPASGQTPVTAVGLGYPVDPVDARSAALGGSGAGLLGGSFSVRNPADLLLHDRPGFGLSLSGEAVTLKGSESSFSTGRERFTAIRALAPFGGWAVSLAFRGEFDQDWANVERDTLRLGVGSVPFEETREHNGGISGIDLSLARQLGPLGIGVSARRLTGSLRQSFFRLFGEPSGGAPILQDLAGAQELAYRAWRFTGGALVRVGGRVVVSGAYSLGGTLFTTVQDSAERTSEFALPGSITVGGSVLLAEELLVTAGAGRTAWPQLRRSAGAAGSGYSSHPVVWVGGGVEFGGFSLLGGRLPLRAGVRRAGLPFSLGEESVAERAVTAGVGWEFQDGLAVFDLSFEAGSRGDPPSSGLAESFRRFTLSLSLRQR